MHGSSLKTGQTIETRSFRPAAGPAAGWPRSATAAAVAQDSRFGDRHHETAPVLVELPLLAPDLVGKVPGQDEEQVDPLGLDTAGGCHLEVRPRGEQSLLEGVFVGDERDQLAPESGRAQERVALGR